MQQDDIKTLANTQLKALANLAQKNGFTDLANQFEFMVVSLETNDSMSTTWFSQDGEESSILNGFNSEKEYEDFVRSQNFHRVVENEFGEQEEILSDDVSGVIPDGNGSFKEVGDLESNLQRVQDIIEENHTIRDEETDEEVFRDVVEPVKFIKILMTRANGSELSIDNVQNRVMTHPQSRTMLQAFGQDYDVYDSTQSNEKIVVFPVAEDNGQTNALVHALQAGTLANFGGRIVVPGLGEVQAEPVFN